MRLLFLMMLSGALASIGHAQSFTNSTSILNPSANGGAPIVVDMNQDFMDDVVRLANGNLVVDYQQTDGTFIQETFVVGIQNPPSWSACTGDLNGDGHMDFLFGSGSNASFILSSADGTEYTETILPEYLFSQRTNIVDIDNDGDLDAFACHDVDQSHPYENDGNGTMSENQSLLPTVPLAGNYASVFVDYDNDGDTDMHMSKCRQGSSPGDPERMNAMYRNNGDGTWTEVAAEIGQDDGDQSWVTVFQDFDNDGDFDTYTVNHYESNLFKLNDGAGNYTQYDAPGLNLNDLDSWSAVGADFDNDGFIDIIQESGIGENYLKNNGDLTFSGLNLPFSDGALCDLNSDGFIDVFTGNTLWLNDGNSNNWVKFSLQGIVSNSLGIGSRVSIYGDFGVMIRECRSGENFRPMSTLNLHFGIGTATAIDSVVVNWPSGETTTIDNPGINTHHILPEAECTFSAGPILPSGGTELCPGESVTLSAPAGYTYEWSDGTIGQSITVSEGGSYSVLVTDGNNCLSLSDPVVVSIVTDEVPEITTEDQTTFCEGQSIMISSSEALGYEWSNGETTQNINVTESGFYSVMTTGLCSDESSSTIEVTVLEAPEPVVSDLETSFGMVDINAAGDNLMWFDDAAGTNLIGTGNTLSYDFNSSPTTLYVQSTTEYAGIMQEGAKEDDAGGGGIPSVGGYSYFDVWEEFTLDRFTVYVIQGIYGERTFNLYDGDNNLMESMTVDLQSDGQHTIEVGWTIPEGDDYYISCNENNLFRNNSGVSYPYAIGDVGELTNSFFGEQYYYYFYGWEITKANFSCTSDLVPVTLSVTSIEELSIENFKAYPNPVNDALNVTFDVSASETITFRILDVIGSTVLEERSGAAQGTLNKTFDLRELPSGIYELQLLMDSEQGSIKFVKE